MGKDGNLNSPSPLPSPPGRGSKTPAVVRVMGQANSQKEPTPSAAKAQEIIRNRYARTPATAWRRAIHCRMDEKIPIDRTVPMAKEMR